MSPNTEPIPAIDAEPNPASDWFVSQVKANDYGVWRHGAKMLVDRIEQEREMRRELQGAVDALLGPFRVREHLRDKCFRCKAEAALARAAKMEDDNAK